MMSDYISRQAAIDAINKLVDRFERILRDIRETNKDESVCGLCEYDGAFLGQSGDWCNECPGFDKDDCFKLSDETRKKWIEEIVNTYPDHTADIGKKVERTAEIVQNVQDEDLIFRKAAIEALRECQTYLFDPHDPDKKIELRSAERAIEDLPTAQPEIVRCKGCEYFRIIDYNELECVHPELRVYTPDFEFGCISGKRRTDEK